MVEIAEHLINSSLWMALCVLVVAMAAEDELNGKLDYIIRRIDEIALIIRDHGLRITSLEQMQIRNEERDKYEPGTLELRVYRSILGQLWKIALAIVIAVLVAAAMGLLKL